MGALKVTLVISLICITLVSSQSYSDSNVTDLDETDTSLSFSGTIASVFVDWISRAIQYISEIFDIKLRATRFFISLYKTENLVLLKRILNMVLRFGEWVYTIIPDSTYDGNNRFLEFLFPQGANEISPEAVYETASSSRSNDRDLLQETQKQILSLNNLINARGNFNR